MTSEAGASVTVNVRDKVKTNEIWIKRTIMTNADCLIKILPKKCFVKLKRTWIVY